MWLWTLSERALIATSTASANKDMKKKIIKGTVITASVVTAVLLLAVTVSVGILFNGFFGNPISKALAKNTAHRWLDTEYANTDYSIDGVRYSFKDGCYYAYIESQNSPDSSFTVYLNMGGKLLYDDFDSRVIGRQNTARRIDAEYRDVVNKILLDDNFAYEFDIGYGTLLFDRDTSLKDFPVGTLDAKELVLDKEYDTYQTGKAAGEITLYLQGEDVTHERLAEILLDIKRIFDEGGIGFNSINLILESDTDGARVEVMSMLYTDIYEDGFLERVIASDNAAKEYYRKQDEEKLKY